MSDNRNFAALEWVTQEIAETLAHARESLEAWAGDPNDTSKIRFCLAHIHQVHGSLQIVEFHGAALLAEELEHLASALSEGRVQFVGEAQEALMRGILQLPIYLDRIKSQRRDQPAVLLPLLNDLRAVRGENLLSESWLFNPDLSPSTRVSGARLQASKDQSQFLATVKKLQEMFRFSAAAYLRGVKARENIQYLHKVVARQYKLTSGTLNQAIWEVALALIEALAERGIEATASVKLLLRLLNKQFQHLAHFGVEQLDQTVDQELLRNLLFYVAISGSNGKFVTRLREKYKLHELLFSAGEEEQDLSPGYDPEAVRTVVLALKEELRAIKLNLDDCLSSDSTIDYLRESLPVAQRVADTLAILGVGDIRKQMLSQVATLEQITTSGEYSDQQLFDLAADMIDIEGRLDGLTRGVSVSRNDIEQQKALQLNIAQEVVLAESRNGLEQTKDCIIEYIASQWDQRHLENVPSLLREIRGGLDMVPLARAGAVLGACAIYIEEQLLSSDQVPEWRSLDTLADAIASIEYYLEHLSGEENHSNDEMLLAVAEDSVRSLGMNAVMAEDPTELRSAGMVPLADEFAQQVEETELPQLESFEENIPVLDPEDSGVIEADEPALVEHASLNQEAELESEPEALEPQPEQQPSGTVAANEDEDPIDPEIIEIFIEEAEEVTGTINEYFPQWAEDFNNNEALTEFRRAFHTLKGSGRMVEATEIGELAWAVENMLNRVIDKTIEASPLQVELISRVVGLLPTMIDAFKTAQPNPVAQSSRQCMAWADEIASGQEPEALTQPEPLEAAPATTSATDDYQDDDQDDDALLWEIFSAEANGHLDTVVEFIDEMDRAAPLYSAPSDSMQRALHTLKGSAHMADVQPIAILATPLEQFIKELRAYQYPLDEDLLQLVKDGVEYINQVLDQIARRETLEIPKLDQYLARINEQRERTVAPIIRQRDSEQGKAKPVDPELLAIFMAEEMNLLLDADVFIAQWRQGDFQQPLTGVQDELATLNNGAGRANHPEMEQLSALLLGLYSHLIGQEPAIDTGTYDLLEQGHELLLDMVDAVAAGQNLPSLDPKLQEAIEAAGDRLAAPVDVSVPDDEDAPQSSAYAVEFNTELDEQPLVTEDLVASSDESVVLELGRDDELIESELEPTLPEAEDSRDHQLIDDEQAHEPALEDLELQTPELDASELEDIESAHADQEAPDLEAEIAESDASELAAELEATAQAIEAEAHELLEPSTEVAAADATQEFDQPVAQDEDPSEIYDAVDESELDQEIIDIFNEEAQELLEVIDTAVHDWNNDWSRTDCLEELTRALHTYKGSARLAGVLGLGEAAHDFETFLLHEGRGELGPDFFDTLNGYYELLFAGGEGVQKYLRGEPVSNLSHLITAGAIKLGAEPAQTPKPVESGQQTDSSDTSMADANDEQVAESTVSDQDDGSLPVDEVDARDENDFEPAPGEDSNVVPFAPRKTIAEAPIHPLTPIVQRDRVSGPPVQTLSSISVAQRNNLSESVKVSSELLEELVNLAGETSISRARMEEQVNEIGQTIDEMDFTIERLQEQLRRLDIETEAQVLFGQEQMQAHDEFDPLEMDRYSALQQLSRSLMESASDLLDLKSTLVDKTKDTETLLLQQSRVNTELQEGLMRSRMVPFSRLVPRLRRIVRQVSTELGKRVNLELGNIEGELDRSMLERMIPPLEHMLRNAVDHGIELPEQRIGAGKAEVGTIRLGFEREGGDVLLTLADDGRGVNLERVKTTAIERGLMSPEAQLSDHDIMQFIMAAGFSTAQEVTQISGRGVGMDVVNQEIKQLGGSVDIDSTAGQGTQFTMRLPFTLSVNRALMVVLGEDQFAVPLNSIEGIVRVSPYELEHYYATPEARFEYAGQQYQVRYLGSMLDESYRPQLDGTALPLPVLLVRSQEYSVALQVDSLLGSREIVVKSLGPQFAGVDGLSGATVMGDGSVVVILDLLALVRRLVAQSYVIEFSQDDQPQLEDSTVRTVIIVDDSVTVRKVTSRFLERAGFDVMTAKDGVEALRMIQERTPDIMLLDIEMPRMDGFEVAKNIRSSSTHSQLPIIMITSRTGQKHRDRAYELGVNNYLGKPYQEDELLESINALTGHKHIVH